jgi:hypothetical protein
LSEIVSIVMISQSRVAQNPGILGFAGAHAPEVEIRDSRVFVGRHVASAASYSDLQRSAQRNAPI